MIQQSIAVQASTTVLGTPPFSFERDSVLCVHGITLNCLESAWSNLVLAQAVGQVVACCYWIHHVLKLLGVNTSCWPGWLRLFAIGYTTS